MKNLWYRWLLIVVGFGSAVAGIYILQISGSYLFFFSSFGGGILISEGLRYVKP